MRLRTRYAIVLLAVGAVLSLVVFGGVELVKRDTIDQVQDDLNETAQQTAETIEQQLSARRDEVRYVARQPVAWDFDDNDVYLQRFVERSRFDSVQVIAPNGTIVDFESEMASRAVERNYTGTDVGDRPYVQAALAGNSLVAGPEYGGGTYVLIISVPLGRPDDGEWIRGALVGGIRVRTAGLFQTVQALDRERQNIVVESGTANGTVDRLPTGTGENTFENPLRAEATVESGTEELRWVENEWYVTVTRDRATLTSRLNSLALVQGGGILAVLGIVVGLGVWEYRTTVSQTERLLDGFRQLVGGDFDHRLDLSAAAEEWNRIGEGFNDLAAGLRERERAIAERERRLSVLNRVLRHNVQNDLSVVQGYLEVLPDMEGERQEDLAEKGLDKTRKLVSHSSKAKQMDRAMESARDGLVELDATAVARQVAEDLADEYPDADVSVDAPDEEMVWAISALEYGVESLVENACKHVEEPTVEVSVTREGDTVAITVADDGPGVPENEQEVLALEEETDLEHGSGVGLWLAQLVAEKSGGDLVFGDQSDGGRATIELAVASTDREALDVAPEPSV